MKTVLKLSLLLALVSASLSAQSRLSDDEVNDLISQLKNAPASQIDSRLPSVPYSEWLASQAGRDAEITWIGRIPDSSDFPMLIESDIHMSNEPEPVLVVMIQARKTLHGWRFRFDSLLMMRKGQYADWPSLTDFPQALTRAKTTMQ